MMRVVFGPLSVFAAEHFCHNDSIDYMLGSSVQHLIGAFELQNM